MIKVKAGKTGAKGSEELKKLYKSAVEDKEREFSWLSPDSYSIQDLIAHCKAGKLYRPLAKSFKLI